MGAPSPAQPLLGPGRTISTVSGPPGATPVEIQDALIEQLAALSLALDEPGADLQAIIAVLMDDLAGAVPSFLGMTITITQDDRRLVLTTMDDGRRGSARASLRLALGRPGSPPVGHIVFYAQWPDAFVGLAADARHRAGGAGRIVVDGDLGDDNTPRTSETLSETLSERGEVYQAIGLLIDRGFLPDEARAQLERGATGGLSRAQAARQLLRRIVPTGDDRTD